MTPKHMHPIGPSVEERYHALLADPLHAPAFVIGPKVLYKYVAANRLPDILKTALIRFTQPSAFNDPIDVAPFVRSVRQATRTAVKETKLEADVIDPINRREIPPFDERVGIFCLTKKRNSLPMWAHYADNHHGVVIQFDVTHPFFGPRLHEVTYSRSRPIFDSPASWNEMELVAKALTTKSHEWAYEQEWRMFLHLKKAKKIKRTEDREPVPLEKIEWNRIKWDEEPVFLFAFPREAIKSLALGRRMPKSKLDEIVELVRTKKTCRHIKLFKARVHAKNYGLEFQPLS